MTQHFKYSFHISSNTTTYFSQYLDPTMEWKQRSNK